MANKKKLMLYHMEGILVTWDCMSVAYLYFRSFLPFMWIPLAFVSISINSFYKPSNRKSYVIGWSHPW